MRSKAIWGYDAGFVEACRTQLSLSGSEAAASTLAVVDTTVLGFHLLGEAEGLAEPDPTLGQLAMLFVDPAAIGTGLGGLLLADAVRAARSRGWRALRIESDPHAEPFYRAHGASRIGAVPSSVVPGRKLPLLQLDIPSLVVGK